MEIQFDTLIKCPKERKSINMKDGLTTFENMANILITIIQTIADKRVPKQKTHKNTVRANMNDTFIVPEPYGLNFKIAISGKSENALAGFDEGSIIELIQYYLAEALYQGIDVSSLTSRSKSFVENEEALGLHLIAQLRGKMLSKAHQMFRNYEDNAELRYKPNGVVNKVIQVFNQESFDTVNVEEQPNHEDIKAVITKFNTLTGTGRLRLTKRQETFAFHISGYKGMSIENRRKFSQNSTTNTGINDEENFKYMSIRTKCYKRCDGKIVKYVVQNIL